MRTSRCSRGVVIVLAGLFAQVVSFVQAQQEEPDTPQVLERKLSQVYRSKDYDAALRHALKLNELQPKESRHCYNVACIYSLVGKKDEALRWLEKSIDLGFRDLNLARRDTDFANIRGEKRFEELLEYMKTREKPPVSAASVDIVVVRPEDFDPEKAYALIVALHGYGRSADRAADAWKEASREFGAVLVAPRGPVSMSQTAFQWGDLEQAVPTVMAAVQKATQQMKIDENRIVLTGFSQGGSLAYKAAMQHPDIFCGVIPVAGRYASSPATTQPADDEGAGDERKLAKAFIMVGRQERDSILKSSEQAAEDFKSAGCDVKLNVYEGVGHAFPENRLEEQLKALHFVLGE